MFNALIRVSRFIRPSCKHGCGGRAMIQMAVATYGLFGALGFIMSTDPNCFKEHPNR